MDDLLMVILVITLGYYVHAHEHKIDELQKQVKELRFEKSVWSDG